MTVYTVTNGTDSLSAPEAGSLRSILLLAAQDTHPPFTITFAANLGTISLAGDLPALANPTSNLVTYIIDGTSGNSIDGHSLYQAFFISSIFNNGISISGGVMVTIKNLTLANCLSQGGHGQCGGGGALGAGGGIFFHNSASPQMSVSPRRKINPERKRRKCFSSGTNALILENMTINGCRAIGGSSLPYHTSTSAGGGGGYRRGLGGSDQSTPGTAGVSAGGAGFASKGGSNTTTSQLTTGCGGGGAFLYPGRNAVQSADGGNHDSGNVGGGGGAAGGPGSPSSNGGTGGDNGGIGSAGGGGANANSVGGNGGALAGGGGSGLNGGNGGDFGGGGGGINNTAGHGNGGAFGGGSGCSSALQNSFAGNGGFGGGGGGANLGHGGEGGFGGGGGASHSGVAGASINFGGSGGIGPDAMGGGGAGMGGGLFLNGVNLTLNRCTINSSCVAQGGSGFSTGSAIGNGMYLNGPLQVKLIGTSTIASALANNGIITFIGSSDPSIDKLSLAAASPHLTATLILGLPNFPCQLSLDEVNAANGGVSVQMGSASILSVNQDNTLGQLESAASLIDTFPVISINAGTNLTATFVGGGAFILSACGTGSTILCPNSDDFTGRIDVSSASDSFLVLNGSFDNDIATINVLPQKGLVCLDGPFPNLVIQMNATLNLTGSSISLIQSKSISFQDKSAYTCTITLSSISPVSQSIGSTTIGSNCILNIVQNQIFLRQDHKDKVDVGSTCQVVLLEASPLSGTFSSVNMFFLPGYEGQVTYTSTQLILTLSNVGVPALPDPSGRILPVPPFGTNRTGVNREVIRWSRAPGLVYELFLCESIAPNNPISNSTLVEVTGDEFKLDSLRSMSTRIAIRSKNRFGNVSQVIAIV